jgi:transcriptional regulator with XRE-family HTH domain
LKNQHPIRAWRLRQTPPVSLDVLARRVGTSKGALSRIETGAQEPQLDTLRKLLAATYSQVSADEIVWWRVRRGAERCVPSATESAE